MAHKSQEEITKSISAPLSSDPRIRQGQKVRRKALVLHKKGFKPKREAKILKSKPKPKVEKKQKKDNTIFGIADKLRRRGRF